MSGKKKLLIVTTILLLLAGGFIRYAIIRSSNIKNAIAWVELNGGELEYETPKWVDKLPAFMHEYFSKDIIGVNIENSPITDISPLKNLNNLTYIDLSGTQVSDISHLKNLTNLTHIYLSGTQDSDISPLKNLSKLEVIWLPNKPELKTQIKELHKALPNCLILMYSQDPEPPKE